MTTRPATDRRYQRNHRFVTEHRAQFDLPASVLIDALRSIANELQHQMDDGFRIDPTTISITGHPVTDEPGNMVEYRATWITREPAGSPEG